MEEKLSVEDIAQLIRQGEVAAYDANRIMSTIYELEEDACKFSALKECGVENWRGYNTAMDYYNENYNLDEKGE